MIGAELVIKALQQHGVDTVFGYPGGAIMPIYDALYDGGIRHYLCRHEQGAAFSAVGYARASGRVGVCMATSGPGATNLITALADAMLDSVPVVAITGQVPTDAMGTDGFQEVDVLGLSLSVTKHSFLVRDASELSDTLQQAFKLAASGRPGPVLVDIPKDVQLAEAELAPALVEQETSLPWQQADIDEAKALIAEARQPVLYVGGGVGMAGAIAPMREFIAQTGIPCVTTLKGIGAIDPQSPYFLGMLGMHGNKAANMAVQECDLLIAAGARFDDRVTGKLDAFAPNAKVIHLDIDAAEFNKRKRIDVAISSDLKQVFPALTGDLDIQSWQNTCMDNKKSHAWRYAHPGSKVYAPAVLKELSDKLPQQSVVSCDVGQHQMWVAQHMSFHSPNNHLSSAGLGTMGFGLPAAIGAQLSRPEDTVVCVSGDGSFMMNVQELTTIKRFQLPLKIVLFDNARLGMVRQWQELFFNQRYSETDLSDNPDFLTLARSFDIMGESINQKSEVTGALNRLISHPGPYLLHVQIDEMENVWPLVPPGQANDQMMEKQQ